MREICDQFFNDHEEEDTQMDEPFLELEQIYEHFEETLNQLEIPVKLERDYL